MNATKPLAVMLGAALLAACSGGGGSDPVQYQVSAQAGVGGSISPASNTATAGSTVTLTVTPDSGHDIASVSGCGGSLSGTSYTTAALSANCTVIASFVLKKYTLSVTVTGSGRADPASSQIEHGRTASISLQPDPGYRIGSVSGCGGNLSGAVYTTAPVTAACTVSADFPSETRFSGVAASGAALSGNVLARDRAGTVREFPIDEDGGFEVDVQGMIPPILLNARGLAGGRSVSYYSVAQQADLGATVNITPFTDLILANVIGGATTGFFESPDFDRLTPEAVDAARLALGDRLRAVFERLSIPVGFDLLRTPFDTDHSGIDAALDFLSVVVEPESRAATITNRLTGESIRDDLSLASDDTRLSDPGPLAAAQEDFAAIVARYQAFAALFATRIPLASEPEYLAFFHSSYRDGPDTTPAHLLVGMDESTRGISYRQIGLVEKISDSQWLTSAILHSPDGKPWALLKWHLIKEDGVWKFAGTQNLIEFKLHPQVWREDGTMDSHIELEVLYGDPAVRFLVLSGPGLNTDLGVYGKGVAYSVGGRTIITRGAILSNPRWLPDCAQRPNAPCFTRAELRSGRHYRLQPLDVNGQPLGSGQALELQALPFTPAEATAQADKLFPSLTKITRGSTELRSRTEAAQGGELTIHWNLPVRAVPACINTLGFEFNGSAGYRRFTDESLDCGVTQGTLAVEPYAGTANLAGAYLWIDHESGVSFGGPLQLGN